MRLPNDIDKRADSFRALGPNHKELILDELRAAPEDDKNAVISDLLKRGGPEARFVKHVLDKSDLPGPDDSPSNKRIGPPNTL